jgi:Ca2+-binding RTX toxin-like protein
MAALTVATVAFLLTLWCGSAVPEGRIVVYGAYSGSTLTLSSHGDRVIVEGYMTKSPPTGCNFARSRMLAVCPLSGVDALELQMGPSGDYVEVADPLPVPLTVYLGAGADKFVGNAEQDTCYGQGTRRNRCVGGPGNDVCISGPQNSDCVGGKGNDFCETSTGSDGCWGGPGADVCHMGPGEDGCHGGPGNDRLYGGPQPDQLYGGPGYDYCNGGPGIGKSHNCESGPGH